MGDGVVLEHGTHNELLRDEQGPYARLVAAQKLREERQIEQQLGDSDSDTTNGQNEDVMQKDIQDEPSSLGRVKSGRSLASDIIEKQKLESGERRERDYSLPYLFRRIGVLNRAGWKNYAIGTVAASSTYFLLL